MSKFTKHCFGSTCLFIFGLTLLWGELLSAEQLISYELRGFGSRHASLVLSGEGSGSLTVSPGSDGMSVRISGVDVQFKRTGDEGALPIISSLNQVKRGAFTDLVLNFTLSSEVTATPSAKDLQVFIRGMVFQSNQANPSQDPLEQIKELTSEIEGLRIRLAAKESELKKLKEQGQP